MTKYPKSFQNLINILNSLPGIGKKSAERLAFSVLNWNEDKLQAFSDIINDIQNKLDYCHECGNIAEKNSLCVFCADMTRKREIICVVENVPQAMAVEAGGVFNGLYHVIGGKIAPLQGKNADSLNIDSLKIRVQNENIKEVIIALGHDVESRATSMYISTVLENFKIKVSIPARGLPAGSDITCADSATLAAAFSGRTIID